MAETVGQHSVAAFTSPVNGTSPIDANTVKGNDNTIRSAYVDHDADPGIHVQSSTLASRPVANSAGRKWMTQDSGVIRLFYDDGTSWYEVDYLRTTGGTISGNLAITGTLAVTGVATFTAQPILSSLTASRAVFTDGSKGLVSNAITGTGDVVMSASPTLTGTIAAASATLSGTLGVSGLLTFASLKGTGATTVTNILDEDNMASDSATALATQQSIKAYVDAQVGASDALSEVLAIGNTTGANDIIVSAGQKIRTPAVAAQDGSSAITIANTTGALTLATALADSNLATISTAGKVSNSATTATDANTASAIVARDASGNFTAGTITAALTGNASTATTLQTARNINGVSFNGSADITVTAAAGTLTGTTLASNVTASSLTSVGTLANLTVTNPITGSVTGSSGSTTGNAATATALQTARNINGVSFNGTADITVTAAAGTLTGTTLASGVTASSLTSVGTLTSLAVTGDLRIVAGSLSLTTAPSKSAVAIQVGTDHAQLTSATSYGMFMSPTVQGTVTNYRAIEARVVTSATTALAVAFGAYIRTPTIAAGGTIATNYGLHIEGQTGATTNYAIYTNAGLVRFGDVVLGANGTASAPAYSNNADTNTGTFFPAADTLAFATGGSERARLDASGNLGLGVTPSAWDTAVFRTVQIGTGAGSASLSGRADGAKDMVLASNVYYGAGSFRYIANGVATTYRTDGGSHAWASHPSGTAGNALGTATGTMTLDASGNLALGITAPFISVANRTDISVNGTTDATVSLGNGGTRRALFYASASEAQLGTKTNIPQLFLTNDTERARITSGGEFIVGATSANASERLRVKGAGNTSATYIVVFENSDATVALSIESAGRIKTGTLADSPYNYVVGGTNRDLYVDSNGNLGYVSSVLASKTNIAPVTDADWLLDLNPVTFNFRKKDEDGNYTDEADGPLKHGLIAEEVEAVNPDLCFYDDEASGGALRGVNYTHLITPMLKLVQAQQAKIESLEARLAALES